MLDEPDQLYERLLVIRCQAGDEEAFAQIVSRYQPRLRYYLRKMLFRLGEPDDVLQDVWLDVFQAVPRLKDAGAFRAWLYQVARARVAKVYRKRRLSFEDFAETLLPDSVEMADALSAEEAECVHAALDKLPAAQREVLMLRYIEDMSYEEIAGVVDCQVGTVRSRLHYAKLALHAQLEEDLRNE